MQCIHSIDRALLNEGLLDELDALGSHIHVFFGHKVIAADFDKKTMTVHDTSANADVSVHFDLCIGADGSYSIVRRQMMRVVRLATPFFYIFTMRNFSWAHQYKISDYQSPSSLFTCYAITE